jgi:N-acetylmuramoyl-L-alanine amidase
MFPNCPNFAESMARRELFWRAASGALSLAASGFALGASGPFKWRIVERNGREYVRASDVRQYYEFADLRRDGRHVHFRSRVLYMKWTIATDAIFFNGVKFCLSFPIEESGGEALISRIDLTKLVDPIIRPGDMQAAKAFNTVVIDAGHGGIDSGARGRYGMDEKDYTLDTAFRLQKALQALRFKTIMTRTTDMSLGRPDRVRIANSIPYSVFVSLHYNASNRAAMGFETFALAPQGTANTDKPLKGTDLVGRIGNNRDAENIALATAVHANCLMSLQSIDRGVKRHRFDVLAGIERPAILVEGGFIDNAAEGSRVHRPEFRQKLADAIAKGIKNFYLAIVPKATPRPKRVPLRTDTKPSLPTPPAIEDAKKEKKPS